MKFKIVATKGRKKIEIPLSRSDLSAMQFLCFYHEEHDWRNFELNRVTNAMKSFLKKITFLTFDVKDEGKAYRMLDNGRIDRRHPTYSYLVRKPRWI